ncbi:MAG: hypothetical protein AAFV96_08880 [Pseudomonadota bacterium]
MALCPELEQSGAFATGGHGTLAGVPVAFQDAGSLVVGAEVFDDLDGALDDGEVATLDDAAVRPGPGDVFRR